MNAFAVIIAGGAGERLWPLSTPERPKQFVSLFGGKPLIRHAMDRLAGLIPPERVLVVTAKNLVTQTRKALPKLPRANILAEPCRRNTAPAVALATREVRRRGGEAAVCCILTADQLMDPASSFRKSLRKAIALAAKGRKIVTLGIKPTFPATGFGYIDSAAKPPRFTEKPDLKTARRFLSKGTFLWNSGMFIFRADKMEAALREYAPDTARLLDASNWQKLYPSLNSISIDYAVMEHTPDIAVIPASFNWDDVGSWNSVSNRFSKDHEGNTRLGKTALLESRGSLVVSTDDHLTAVMGLDEVIVVHTDRATLVCAKSKAQEIKRLLAKGVLALALMVGFVGAASAERYPFERYQSVVDRQMFGAVPDGFDPSKPPSEVARSGSRTEKELTKEQEKIKSSIRFSAINVTPSGETAVGFTDSSNPKEVRHYYLKVGEKRDGWEVKAADPLKASMTIAKGDISLDLELGANSAQGGGTATRTTQSAQLLSAPKLTGGAAHPAGGVMSTLRSRLEERRKSKEAQAKADEEAKAKADEEKARAEEEKQQMKQQLHELMENQRMLREEKTRKESEAKATAEQKSAAEAEAQE